MLWRPFLLFNMLSWGLILALYYYYVYLSVLRSVVLRLPYSLCLLSYRHYSVRVPLLSLRGYEGWATCGQDTLMGSPGIPGRTIPSPSPLPFPMSEVVRALYLDLNPPKTQIPARPCNWFIPNPFVPFPIALVWQLRTVPISLNGKISNTGELKSLTVQ